MFSLGEMCLWSKLMKTGRFCEKEQFLAKEHFLRKKKFDYFFQELTADPGLCFPLDLGPNEIQLRPHNATNGQDIHCKTSD